VCGNCYDGLLSKGAVAVSETGEFAVVSADAAAQLLDGGLADSPATSIAAGSACTWCGKRREQVKKMLSSPSAHICNECVALCSDILSSELGEDWRS
jgi:hypothetical protein